MHPGEDRPRQRGLDIEVPFMRLTYRLKIAFGFTRLGSIQSQQLCGAVAIQSDRGCANGQTRRGVARVHPQILVSSYF